MIYVVEEVVHLIPLSEFILLLILCLKSTNYIENNPINDTFEAFKIVSITSACLAFINFFIGLSLSFKTGVCGCTKMIETKMTLCVRVIDEIIMIINCTCVFYLMHICYDNNASDFYNSLFVFYLLGNLLYTATALANFVIVVTYIRDYRDKARFTVLNESGIVGSASIVL